jgi:hypothetical protein
MIENRNSNGFKEFCIGLFFGGLIIFMINLLWNVFSIKFCDTFLSRIGNGSTDHILTKTENKNVLTIGRNKLSEHSQTSEKVFPKNFYDRKILNVVDNFSDLFLTLTAKSEGGERKEKLRESRRNKYEEEMNTINNPPVTLRQTEGKYMSSDILQKIQNEYREKVLCVKLSFEQEDEVIEKFRKLGIIGKTFWSQSRFVQEHHDCILYPLYINNIKNIHKEPYKSNIIGVAIEDDGFSSDTEFDPLNISKKAKILEIVDVGGIDEFDQYVG